LVILLLLHAAHHPQLWCEELHLGKVYLHVQAAEPSRRRVVDNPPRAGITVAPLDGEVWVSIGRSKKEKRSLSTTRVSQF
jgi:hypothetical protein